MRVGNPEVQKLDPMLAVVEVQLTRKKDGWGIQPACCNVGPRFGRIFPAAGFSTEIPGFVAAHFLQYAGVRNGDSPVFDPDLIAVRVIAVVMSIEGEAYGLVRQGSDFG